MSGRAPPSQQARHRPFPQGPGGALARAARWAVPLALVVGSAAGYLASRAPTSYSASTTLLAVGPTRADASMGLLTAPAIDPLVLGIAVANGPVAGTAFRAIYGRAPSLDELRRFRRRIRVEVQHGQKSSLVRVTCQAPDADPAVACANALAAALIGWDRTRGTGALRRTIATFQDDIAGLTAVLNAGESNGRPLSKAAAVRLRSLRQTRVDEVNNAKLRLASAVPFTTLSPLPGGSAPASLVARRPFQRGGLATASCLVLALAVASLAYLEGRRQAARPSLADSLGLPVLGELSASASGDGHAPAETIDLLASRIERAARTADSLVIAVTSFQERSASQGVSIALATRLARVGHGVLLVDADLREGTVTRQLDVPRSAAAPLDWHLEHPRLDNTPTIVRLKARRSCDFIPSFGGVEHPSELLSRGLASCLETWRGRYRVVLLDGPSIVPFADMQSVVPLCGGVLVCADRGHRGHADRYDRPPLPATTNPELTGLILTRPRPTRPPRPARRSRSRRSADHGP